MSKKSKGLRIRLMRILEDADTKSELYTQVIDKIVAEVEREMLHLQEAFRDNADIMYDDNTDEFLAKYIRKKYHNKIDPATIKK